MARPKLYDDSNEFEKRVNKYFEDCDNNNRPYTMSGLANSLDMDRRTLLNYSKSEKFFLTIKKAKQRVEQQLEENLYRLGNNSGIIFNLKNNFNWKDNEESTNADSLSKVQELLNKIKDEANDIK